MVRVRTPLFHRILVTVLFYLVAMNVVECMYWRSHWYLWWTDPFSIERYGGFGDCLVLRCPDRRTKLTRDLLPPIQYRFYGLAMREIAIGIEERGWHTLHVADSISFSQCHGG